jgi:hypothetical protein
VSTTEPTPEAGTSRRQRRRQREERRGRTRFVVSFLVATVLTATAALWLTGVIDTGDATSRPTVARDPAPIVTHPTTTAAAATTKTKCRSPLTTTTPLKLWIGGDSLAGSLGPSLGSMTAATGVVAPVYDSRVSSGLANPKFFDWPKHATQEMARLNPEVVAFIIGTNDYTVPNATSTAKTLDGTGQPAWSAVYALQVEQMLQILIGGTTPGTTPRTVYWIGAPILKDTKMDAGAVQINEVAQEVIARHPGVTYIDAHTLFAGPDGGYTTTLTGLNGKQVRMRAGDGVHLTPDGGDLLADAVFQRLDARCHVQAQTVAGFTQPVIQSKGSTAIPGTGRTPSGSRAGSATTSTTATPATTAPSASTAPTTTLPSTSTSPTAPSTTADPPPPT